MIIFLDRETESICQGLSSHDRLVCSETHDKHGPGIAAGEYSGPFSEGGLVAP